MKDLDLIEAEHIGKTNEMNVSGSKKPYTAPNLHCYGSLVDLVQNTPANGTDGGPVDCNFS